MTKGNSTLESKMRGDKIKKFWNDAAKENAIKYITSFDNINLDQFYASGIQSVEGNLNEIFPERNLENLYFNKILEIGCGLGRESFTLSDYCKELYAIDISPEMINQAKSNSKEFQVKNKIYFSECNGINFKDFQPNTFDFIYSYQVLQHQGTIVGVFSNLIDAQRVLKKSGIAALLIRVDSLDEEYKDDFLQEVDAPPIPIEELKSWTRRMKFKNAKFTEHRLDKSCRWLIWTK